jgi:phthiocerol/phenolphthiocerol synthesis type-I polyketide synthase C
VKYTGLNFRDVLASMGLLNKKAVDGGRYGLTTGEEASGIVTAVGSKVTQFKPGDRVLAYAVTPFQKYARVESHLCFHVPSNMSLEVASTILLVFVTVYVSLVDIGRIRPNSTVSILHILLRIS